LCLIGMKTECQNIKNMLRNVNIIPNDFRAITYFKLNIGRYKLRLHKIVLICLITSC